MAVQTHPRPTPAALQQRPQLRLVEATQRVAQLHLFTFVVGNAVFWTLWAAIAVTSDDWYWWPIAPFVGWGLILAAHLWRIYRAEMAPTAVGGPSRAHVAALALIAGLVAGPGSTHVYWMLGGTWGLYTAGVRDEVASTGTRVVAAVVVLLLIAAVLVVLARVGWWRQTFVSDRVIRFFAWALAATFLLETLAAFTWSRGEHAWWMYGSVSLVIAALASVVAGSGGAWPRVHRPRRILPPQLPM